MSFLSYFIVLFVTNIMVIIVLAVVRIFVAYLTITANAVYCGLIYRSLWGKHCDYV